MTARRQYRSPSPPSSPTDYIPSLPVRIIVTLNGEPIEGHKRLIVSFEARYTEFLNTVLYAAHVKGGIVYNEVFFDFKKNLNLRYIMVSAKRAQTLVSKPPRKNEYTDLNDPNDYAALQMDLKRMLAASRNKFTDVIQFHVILISVPGREDQSDVEEQDFMPEGRKFKVPIVLKIHLLTALVCNRRAA